MNQVESLSLCPLAGMQAQRICQSPPLANTGQRTGQTFPLALLGPGGTGRISNLRGQSEMVRHLTELGFVEDAEIKVVSGNFGNLIVELKGSRLAIGRQLAAHIIVTK